MQARAQSDKRELAGALNALAQLERVEGHPERTLDSYDEVVRLMREVGDHESAAVGLLNLAMVSITQGHDGRARAMIAEALDAVRRCKLPPGEQERARSLRGPRRAGTRLGESRALLRRGRGRRRAIPGCAGIRRTRRSSRRASRARARRWVRTSSPQRKRAVARSPPPRRCARHAPGCSPLPQRAKRRGPHHSLMIGGSSWQRCPSFSTTMLYCHEPSTVLSSSDSTTRSDTGCRLGNCRCHGEPYTSLISRPFST